MKVLLLLSCIAAVSAYKAANAAATAGCPFCCASGKSPANEVGDGNPAPGFTKGANWWNVAGWIAAATDTNTIERYKSCLAVAGATIAAAKWQGCCNQKAHCCPPATTLQDMTTVQREGYACCQNVESVCQKKTVTTANNVGQCAKRQFCPAGTTIVRDGNTTNYPFNTEGRPVQCGGSNNLCPTGSFCHVSAATQPNAYCCKGTQPTCRHSNCGSCKSDASNKCVWYGNVCLPACPVSSNAGNGDSKIGACGDTCTCANNNWKTLAATPTVGAVPGFGAPFGAFGAWGGPGFVPSIPKNVIPVPLQYSPRYAVPGTCTQRCGYRGVFNNPALDNTITGKNTNGVVSNFGGPFGFGGFGGFGYGLPFGGFGGYGFAPPRPPTTAAEQCSCDNDCITREDCCFDFCAECL